MRKITKNILNISLLGIVIAGTIIGNVVAYAFETQLSSLLYYKPIEEETLAAASQEGQKLSKQIVQEGSVLVKNKDNVLPLDIKTDLKVNVFGHSAIDWAYSGYGSGRVMPENDIFEENIDFLKALKKYGVSYNEEIISMYRKYADTRRYGSDGTSADLKLYEPSITDKSFYSDTLLNNAKNYSNTAFVVITRATGEGADVNTQTKFSGKNDNRKYISISSEEEDLLKYCADNFEKTIVIVNSTNTMELGFLDKIDVDACLIVGATGTRGAEGIPSLLYGELSPSGRLVDTYAYDVTTNIAYHHATMNGLRTYTNDTTSKFYDYVENIYVGYKWYETADKEGVWNNRKTEYGTGYEGIVQYPFGYGLTYSDFSWNVEKVTIKEGEQEITNNKITDKSKIYVDVKVKNVGNHPSKEVVQIYLTAPYTKGEIEKSYVSLVGFEKTSILEKDTEEILTIELKASDFTSYDCYDKNSNGFKGYELEQGDYELKLMRNAHELNTSTTSSSSLCNNGVITLNVEEDIKIENDPVTGNKVQNLFTGSDAVDGISLDGNDGTPTVNYISRSEFPLEEVKPVAREITDNQRKYKLYTELMAANWDNATTDVFGNPVDSSPVTWGQGSGKKVYQSGLVTELGYELGADYNSEKWEEVLNQVTINEALDLIGKGYSGNQAVPSIGKEHLKDYDGPAQIKGFTGGPRGTGYPMQPVLAATFNKRLAYLFGLSYGKDMQSVDVNGTYGFGVNIHRAANCGRNFEYYSEDTCLSAEMLTNAIKGLQNAGKYGYIKHFALNESETNRVGVYTWSTEQALREIYLKPFQKAIQEADCVAIMSSYNRMGGVYAGGSEALLNGVLRKEWGFKGMIITDYAGGNEKNMNLDQALRATGDLGMSLSLNHPNYGYGSNINYSSTSTNRVQNRLKEAVHHVVYAWLRTQYINKVYNENANEEDKIVATGGLKSWEWWKIVLVDLDILIGAGCILWIYLLFRKKEFFLEKEEN